MSLIKIFSSIIVAILLSQHTNAAIDVELADKNLLQVQKLGSQFKRERDVAALLPPKEAHHDAALEATDTDLLVKAAHNHINADYLKFAKAGIIAIVIPWVTQLSGFGANSKLVIRTAGGNMEKKEFTDALELTINKVISFTVPLDKKLPSLKRAKDAINQEIADAVKAWVDTLLVGNTKFLFHPLAGANRPLGQSRDHFKTKIEEMIKTF
jgi:hypothetical protein